MGKFTEILKSFSLQETLNPKIWDNYDDPKEAKMKPKVRKALERIAEEFIDYLGEDVMVEDIILTGSLANYNWSNFSDFDLHVLIDLQQYEKESETYKELYDLKKRIFNDSHDIKIMGYDVELYAQDKEESHVSSAVYSVANDEWINVPKKDFKKIDKNVLVNKIDNWVEKIETAIKDSETEGVEKLETIKDKLKEYRKCGLEKGGELSYENLVFKFLRRSKHIEKLFDKVNQLKDKELSVEQHLNEQDTKKEKEEVFDIIENSVFLKKLKDLVDDKKIFEYTPGIKIPYSKEVELIQTALQFLGYSLPKWGIDGKLGPETKNSITRFQEEYGIRETGSVGEKELKYFLAMLVIKGFKDENLSSIIKNKQIDTSGLNDKNFYEKLLKELGAPTSDENMKFLYAWRQAEGKAGKYNPFNTTHKMPDSTNFNKVGVKNYTSIEDGLIATLKTLRNGRYDCIVNGLKNDIGAAQIAKCPSLEVWGTGDLVAKVVKGYESGSSPKVSSLA